MVYLNYWYTISLGIKCMQYKLQYVEDMLSFTWNMWKIFNPLRSQCKKNSRRMSQYVHRMFVSLPLSSDIDTVFQKKYNLAWIWLTMGQIPIQYDPQRATKRKSQWSNKFPTWLSFSYLTVYYQTPQAGEVRLPHKAALLYSPANIQNQPHLTWLSLKSY